MHPLFLLALVAAPLFVGAESGSLITNNEVSLGVSDQGHLIVDVPGGNLSYTDPEGAPSTVVGLRLNDPIGISTQVDGITDGPSTGEGWGVSWEWADTPAPVPPYMSAHSRFGDEYIGAPTAAPYAGGTSVAVVVPDEYDEVEVTHDFHPSTLSPYVYEVDVRIENILTNRSLKDIRYRRAVVWTAQPSYPGDGDKATTSLHWAAPKPAALLETCGGTAVTSISLDPTDLGCPAGDSMTNAQYTDVGPQVSGFAYTVGGFPEIAPGEAVEFTLLMGAAPDEASAESALASAGAAFYGLAKSDGIKGKFEDGKPATFFSGWRPKAEGHVTGDPHFVGFDGVSFDFGGLELMGRPFALLQTRDVAVNALLGVHAVQGLVYMEAVSVRTAAGGRIAFRARNGKVTVEIGDVLVDLPAPGSAGVIAAGDVEVTALAGADGAVDGRVRLETRGIALVLAPHGGEFVDVASAELSVAPAAIHGVLGQTALVNRRKDGERGYQGEEADYVVADLWGTEFRWSVYEGEAAQKASRKMGAKRFASQVAQPSDLVPAAVTN